MGTIIAIPTYFGNQMLTNCIGSIMKNVKNPQVLIYKNDIGWLKACNEVMRKTSDDIILLNDDTFILTDIVEEMSRLAYSDPRIGIVGGKSLSPNEIVNNYGIYVGIDGNTSHRYYGKRRDEINHVEQQKAIEGSCFFVKREVIDRIGVFDEAFGMGYREEVDYCFRARESGYKVVSTPRAEYVHFVSQTNSPLGITNDTFDIFMKKWGAKLTLGKV
jgi:GT2 family glycosyltransferase